MPSSRTSALFTREVGNLRWWPAALHQVAWVVVLAIAATVTPSVTRAQDAGWTQLEPIGRYGQAMCFDSVRARTVMFGGTTPLSTFGTTDNNETWEWNGAAWTSRGQGGPTARRFAAMAYDSVRHVSVLFGGYYLNSANDVQLVSSDTWEWDGSTWTQRAVAGPSPRYAHAMVYDSSRQVMVLFGGRDAANNAFSDTWEWNGTSWSQRVVTGPETRYAHAMAFDPIRNVTVLYGGYDPNFGATLSDTWEWNGTAWTRRTVTGPGGRNGAGMAFDAASSSVLLFGGAFSGGETWGWNGTAWSRRATTGPAERSNIPLALDTSRNVVVLVGGPNSTFAETWEWDGTAWTQRQSNLPSPRLFHAMAHDPERHRTVLFGGAATGVEQADTWEWIGAQWVRQNVTGPSMRQAHAMTYDSQRNVSVLFGGATSAGQLYGDTWEYDGSWTQRATTGPSARYGHAMAFDAAHGQTVLFGGRLISLTPTTVFADTWTWNGASWSQRTVAGPAPRWGAGMAFDADRGNTVLFGGTSGTGATLRHFDDTWTWNGAAWSRQRVSGPSARYSQTMAFDPVRHVVVLFGGGTLASPYGADAWEWDGDMWSRRPDAGPVGRFGSAMVFDTTLGGVMIYGGGAVPPGVTSFTNIADTWGLAMTAERCPAPKIGLSPATRGVVCRGASQTLTLTGSGLPGLAYQWRRGTPGAALAGQTGATLTLPSIGASDADMYDCLVTTSCGVVTTNAVRLTMCAADVNCSATVDVTDIFDFLRLWFAGDSLGDFDGSGFLSIQDVFALINAWFVGC